MKKIVLGLCFFFSLSGSVFMRAQAYFPEFAETPEWYIYGTSNVWSGIMDTETLKFEKDTLLCGINYSKILIEKGNLCGTGNSNFIRSENQKVYYKSDKDCTTPEKVLYDFSLGVGDSTYCAFNCKDSVLFKVDTIETINYLGSDRKKISLRFKESPSSLAGYYYMVWIEGIGSLTHPFYPSVCILDQCESYYELTCMFVSGTQWYQNPNYFSCNVSSSEDIESMKTVKIYPNPTDGKFQINSKEEAKLIKIFDFSGKLLIEEEKIEAVGKYHLVSGTYWVQVQTDLRNFQEKLIIIH